MHEGVWRKLANTSFHRAGFSPLIKLRFNQASRYSGSMNCEPTQISTQKLIHSWLIFFTRQRAAYGPPGRLFEGSIIDKELLAKSYRYITCLARALHNEVGSKRGSHRKTKYPQTP